MKGAHQQIHQHHSAQRRCLRDRAEKIGPAAAENNRQQRHHCEGWRGRKRKLVGHAEGGSVAAFGVSTRFMPDGDHRPYSS